MKLTEKDIAFLSKLRLLMQQKELWVETRKSYQYVNNLCEINDAKGYAQRFKNGTSHTKNTQCVSELDYMILRGNYGEKISRNFHMTRQGVRWRFQRLMNQVYVEAFETILAIESTLGNELRQDAIRISKQRHQLRMQLTSEAFENAPGSAPGNALKSSLHNHDDHINKD